MPIAVSEAKLVEKATETNLSRRRFFHAAAGTRGVAIIVDPRDAVASMPVARWAAEELQRALTKRGAAARTAVTRCGLC
jgi:hypothetical protein